MSLLTLEVVDTGAALSLEPRGVVIAGYTGRDRAAALRHVEELEAIGVPRPARIPDVNLLDGDLVTLAGTITTGPSTSGEAEPVLVFSGGDYYLGVGSDHTDRELEKLDMRAAKSACEKPLSRRVYSSAWAAPRFERLVLSSTTGAGEAYQRESCAYFLPLDELVETVAREVGDLDGLVLFCGTVPLLSGEFRFASRYAVFLTDPTTGEGLQREYLVETEAAVRSR